MSISAVKIQSFYIKPFIFKYEGKIHWKNITFPTAFNTLKRQVPARSRMCGQWFGPLLDIFVCPMLNLTTIIFYSNFFSPISSTDSPQKVPLQCWEGVGEWWDWNQEYMWVVWSVFCRARTSPHTVTNNQKEWWSWG